MLSLDLPCWLAALSKVTWPHLLLACSKHSPDPAEHLFNYNPLKNNRLLTIMHGVPRCGAFKDTSARSLFRCLVCLTHNVRDQISSCFLHTRSAQITQRTATLPNPSPSSWQQVHFSQSKLLPSYLPWQLPQRWNSANAHAIQFFFFFFCIVQCAFTSITSCT